MTEAKRVFVVMGNDFPDAVYETETAAEAHCERKRRAEEDAFVRANGKPMSRFDSRIHWRIYPFAVLAQ